MPLSRPRQRPLHRRQRIPARLQNDMRLEALFDRATYGTGLRGPRMLYHYTSWDAAESILRSQRFRATAHDCTNDSEELTYADATIVDAARASAATADAAAQGGFQLFVEAYNDSRIGNAKRTFLLCFSRLRDDLEQWTLYGMNSDRVPGAGVCLGLRILGASHPIIPDLATGFMPVTYGYQAVRDGLSHWLPRFGAIG